MELWMTFYFSSPDPLQGQSGEGLQGHPEIANDADWLLGTKKVLDLIQDLEIESSLWGDFVCEKTDEQ